ncbi:uncharacterized protein LOC119927401 [Tachyglossus aculeatus]|uniref:uncharacterized protein LOC119927401 n=1 Tax=Tachyglossus aculeatus TaxID=9261 RepID=UPI0018F2922C|nr:uncharacterized protein LOC119927401 [Tachyglossus aculeatus]
MWNRRGLAFAGKRSADRAALAQIFFILSQLYSSGETRPLQLPQRPGRPSLRTPDVDWYNSGRGEKLSVPSPSLLPTNALPLVAGPPPAAAEPAEANEALRFEFVKNSQDVLEEKHVRRPSQKDSLKTGIFACLVVVGLLLIVVTVFQILTFCHITHPTTNCIRGLFQRNKLSSDRQRGGNKQADPNGSSSPGDFPGKSAPPPPATRQSDVSSEAQYSPAGDGDTPATSPPPHGGYDSSPGGSVGALEPGEDGEPRGESRADAGNSPRRKTGRDGSEWESYRDVIQGRSPSFAEAAEPDARHW